MWRVRLDDGSEYGPVDEGKLLSWAREGRITPSSQISSDGTTWILAPQKPELGMDWLVEVSPGEYFGPFHHDVLQWLLDSKKITSETRSFRLVDGSEPALKSEIGKLKADCEQLRSSLSAASKRETTLAEKAESALSEMRNALEQEKSRGAGLDAALQESKRRDESLAAENEELRAQLRKAELESAKSEEKAAAELKRAVSERESETARADELVSEVDRLNASLGREKSQNEQLRASLAAELESVRSELEKSRSRNDSAQNRINELSQALESEQARGGELGKMLAASGGRETSLAEELSAARAEIEKERKACEDLRIALKKSKKTEKRSVLGGLFKGKSRQDLSFLELAAQRELARRKFGRGIPGPKCSDADVIDI